MHYTSKEVYQSISQQTNDPIVEWKTCRISWAEFPIYKSDLDFYDKISPVFNGVRYQIPTPTLCPEERQRRRLIFRNDRKLYRGRCDLTNKPIITIYKPESGYKVYSQEGDGVIIGMHLIMVRIMIFLRPLPISLLICIDLFLKYLT